LRQDAAQISGTSREVIAVTTADLAIPSLGSSHAAANSAARKLPNMNEFSPGQLDTNSIRQVLRAIESTLGDRDAMVGKIASCFPRLAATPSEVQRLKRANNVLIGMSQCGLLERSASKILPKFTELAQTIASATDDRDASALFARHLLQKCEGLELLDVVMMIRARAEEVTLDAIRAELRARRFLVTENEGNASKLRQWLEPAGVVDASWEIDEKRLHSLLGVTPTGMSRWYELSQAQRAFLRQLRALNGSESDGWVAVRQIKRLVEQTYGRGLFPEGALRASVIKPLVTAGWVETRGERSGANGRGGDSGDVRALSALLELDINQFDEKASTIPAELRGKLSMPIDQIFDDIGSPDTYVKGLALEVLALRFARDIGLSVVGFRERGVKTQGAEVDLVAESLGFHYSRWLIQCKNTSSVHVSHVAKEAGMASVLNAQVICMVTTGRFGTAAAAFADGLSRTTSLQVLMVDGPLLAKYRQNGALAILDNLRSQVSRIQQLKQGQVIELQEE
jgi:hypothetical protein